MNSSEINKKKDNEATWFMYTSSSSSSYSNRSIFRSFDKVSLKGSFSHTRPSNKASRWCMQKETFRYWPPFWLFIVDFVVVAGVRSIAIRPLEGCSSARCYDIIDSLGSFLSWAHPYFSISHSTRRCLILIIQTKSKLPRRIIWSVWSHSARHQTFHTPSSPDRFLSF